MENTRVGKYTIVARIGSGAMGEVYRAHDPVLGRDVAVKTMAELYAADDQLVARFRREAQSAARLNHPNIVTVFDFGEERGRFYMAMELLDGSDLKELIATRAISDLWDKIDVMEQVAEGLAYAHQQGVVHRDLKPANLRVLPNGRVKIMDFGLARLGSSDMTRAGMVMGTPNYMSPEQVRGERADARSDVFSLGAVFYELLASKKAFDAESMHRILYRVLEEEPEPIRRWLPSLPAAFVEFVETCLQKDPERRFQNAGELRAALRKVREALASAEVGLSPQDAESTATSLAVDATAPTIMGAPPTSLRSATTGAAALDLTRLAAASETLLGAPTLSGGDPTAVGEELPQEPAPSRWPVYAATAVAAVVVVGALSVVAFIRARPAPVAPAPVADTSDQVGALKEALVGNQVELARVDLENKDYRAAVSRAQRALTIDPSSAEARQVLAQAQRTAAELETAAAAAKAAFERGDTDAATRDLARVLSLDPRHPVAGQLTAALNVHFRKQAEDARDMAEVSRRAADPTRAADAEGFARADRLVREASALLQGQEFAVATQKYLESRDAFDRVRRAAEVAARAAAVRATAVAAAPAVAAPITVAPAPVQVPPVAPPVAPVTTLPEPAPPPATLAASTPEPAIRKVIADYGRAIEGKDIALFRTVKPNLTPDEEKRLQDAFKAIKSQQVGITIEAVQVDGGQATVRVTRQDTINGNRVKAVQQVFRLAQQGGGWRIETIGVQ